VGHTFNLCFRKISNGFEGRNRRTERPGLLPSVASRTGMSWNRKLDPSQFLCVHHSRLTTAPTKRSTT